MVEDRDPVGGTTPQNEGEMSESEIDKNLQDSFPASDPPSWTLGSEHLQKPPVKDESDVDDPPRH